MSRNTIPHFVYLHTFFPFYFIAENTIQPTVDCVLDIGSEMKIFLLDFISIFIKIKGSLRHLEFVSIFIVAQKKPCESGHNDNEESSNIGDNLVELANRPPNVFNFVVHLNVHFHKNICFDRLALIVFILVVNHRAVY